MDDRKRFHHEFMLLFSIPATSFRAYVASYFCGRRTCAGFDQERVGLGRWNTPEAADAKGDGLSFANGVGQLSKAADLEYDHRGVRRTPYSLRHFYVSQQLAHGVPIHDLARNTRTSIQMMDKHYAQVQVERMKDSLRPDGR